MFREMPEKNIIVETPKTEEMVVESKKNQAESRDKVESSDYNPEDIYPEDVAEHIKNLRMEKAKDFLQKEGVIRLEGEKVVLIDKEKIYSKELRQRATKTYVTHIKNHQILLLSMGVIDYLLETEAVLQNEKESVRPLILLPKDKRSALNGTWDNGGILDPSSNLRESVPWRKIIKLSDGTELNFAELTIAKKLNDLKARRDANGKLEIFNEKENRYVDFTTRLFVELSGINPCITENELTQQSDKPAGQKIEGRLQFDRSGALFAEKYLKNLTQESVLKISDFPVKAFGQTSELFRQTDKKFGEDNPYVYFVNDQKHGAKYYVGKKTITGTETEVTENTNTARQLDPQTIGILDKSHGKERILYQFNLLNGSEVVELHQRIRNSKRKKVGPERKWLAVNMMVGGKEMKNRIKEYKTTDFVKQKNGETAKDYGERMSQLSNVSFVTEKLQGFFRKAGIGLHKLPWRDQLLIADITSVEADEDRLQKFAKKYGLEGLRTFLSLEYGKEIGKDIIMLGEKLPSEEATAIFAKYSEIVDTTSDVAEQIREKLKKDKPYSPEDIDNIRDNLLKKGRGMLVVFSSDVKETRKQIDIQGLRKKLESIKTDILVFASIFKTFSQSKTEGVTLDDINKVEISTHSDISNLGQEQKEMARIFEANRTNYSPNLLKETKGEFEEVLKNNNSEFHILKYDGEVVAFIRFDTLPNGNLYAGSLNVRPEIRGSAIGSSFLHEVLEKKSEEKEIEAVVYSKNPMLKHYLDDFGFKIVDDIPNYKGTSELFHKMVLSKKITA